MIIAAVIVAIIVYGSLYPFRFDTAPDGSGPLWSLLKSWAARPRRGDVAANILLYMPLGFILFRLSKRLFIAVLLGAALSVCIELLQYYAPRRNSVATDVYSNTFGTFIGAIGGMLFSPRLSAVMPVRLRGAPFPLLLLVAWLGYRLYPYVPVIDLHKYWDALKPVFLYPSLSLLDLFHHTVTWLTIAALLENAAERGWGRKLFFLFVIGTMGAQILIMGQSLTLAELVGAAFAIAGWLLMAGMKQTARLGVVAALLLAFVIAWRLEPFTFGPPHDFGFIPFESFLHGSMVVNAQSFLEKSFYYGALVWLLTQCGVAVRTAGLFVALVLLSTSVAEMYLPRSAEITDAVIALAAALVLWLVTPGGIVSPRRKPIG